jgi:glycosyltransferase involved in cell wall biosynthesis
MDAIRGTDATAELVARPYVARSAALDTPTHFSRWRAMERFAIAGLRQIEEWADRHPYEWMYSRATFPASHLLAAAHKLGQPEVWWTAEFSDPISRDVRNHERGAPVGVGELVDRLRAGLSRLGRPLPATANSLVWCEELPYALADELVFTNANQLEHMLGYCSDPELAARARARAVVRPHPTPPAALYGLADADYPLEDGAVHLGYFGKFYPRRGLDDVLTAIATLPPATRSRLRIHAFTRRHGDLRSRAAELGVDEQVRVGPYLGYLEFLNLTTKLDCLVVNDVVTSGTHRANPYLPSKWSDYRGSGTPVWGLVEAGSPLSGEPLDHTSPVGDVAAAREVLERLVATSASVASPAARHGSREGAAVAAPSSPGSR